MEIAVLDLGSTTVHLQTFRVEGHRLVPELDVKRSTLLGSQVFTEGVIDARAWLLNVETVGELLRALRTRDVAELRVVATSAIRSACNGGTFVEELERRFGIEVRVLESREEARLSFLGQAGSQVVDGRRIAAVDIGGGSVEVALGEGVTCVRAESLPLGALRALAEPGDGSCALSSSQARALSERVRARLATELDWARAGAPELTVFGSGSARAARKLLLRDSHFPGKIGPIDPAAFRSALHAHLGMSVGRLVELGVEPPRAPSVLIVAVLMVELMHQIGSAHAYVSDKGLRDGVAVDALRRREHEVPRALRFMTGSMALPS